MSFGFSIGDFITIIEHANKIRKEFVGSPSQFKAISDEVRNFSFLLQDVEVDMCDEELNTQQKTKLLHIAKSCRDLLTEIEITVRNYQELKTMDYEKKNRVKRVWKRLKWEPDDIRDLRHRLNSNTSLLNAFNSRITREGVSGLLQHQVDQGRQAMLDWLSSVSFAKQQSDYVSRRQPGTGDWLLETTEFHAWITGPKQTLFCPGIPGAGKTTLTSIVVEELFLRYGNDSDTAISYFYCNFKRQEEENVEKLLAALLRQITQGKPSSSVTVQALYDKHTRKGTRPSIGEISVALHSVSSHFSQLFILIDALDEFQVPGGSRNKLLDEIFSLQEKFNINFLTTSRFIPAIISRFEGKPSLEIFARKQDVIRYLQGNLAKLPSFVSCNAELQEDITSGISQAADGMRVNSNCPSYPTSPTNIDLRFLLAQLYLDSLAGKRSPKAIRSALTRFSSGTQTNDFPYDDAYNEAIQRIQCQSSDQKEMALQVLSWIACARKQLTTVELRTALAVEVGESEFDEENLPEVADMVSLCAGLVTIDKVSDIVRLVHYTAQAYFERTWTRWFPNAHSEIATICVTYLSFDSFKAGACCGDDEYEARLLQYPLYSYAARNWGYHNMKQAISQGLVMQFLNDESKLDASAQALLAQQNQTDRINYSQPVPKHITGFHLVASLGLEREAHLLIELGNESDFKDSFGRTPLSWAARDGCSTMVQLLLKNGGDSKSKDRNGQTPLSLAASKGHMEVVRLLLEESNNPDSKDIDGRTPLSYAASYGHRGIVQTLLERGADPESQDQYGQTPILWAAKCGCEEVVGLLLEYGVDPDTKMKNGMTPLSWAVVNGHEAVVQLLLNKDVEAASEDIYGKTPVNWAAERGNKVVQRLFAARTKN